MPHQRRKSQVFQVPVPPARGQNSLFVGASIVGLILHICTQLLQATSGLFKTGTVSLKCLQSTTITCQCPLTSTKGHDCRKVTPYYIHHQHPRQAGIEALPSPAFIFSSLFVIAKFLLLAKAFGRLLLLPFSSTFFITLPGKPTTSEQCSC